MYILAGVYIAASAAKVGPCSCLLRRPVYQASPAMPASFKIERVCEGAVMPCALCSASGSGVSPWRFRQRRISLSQSPSLRLLLCICDGSWIDLPPVDDNHVQHPVRAPVPSVVEPVALAPLDALRGDVSHSTAKVAFERMHFGFPPLRLPRRCSRQTPPTKRTCTGCWLCPTLQRRCMTSRGSRVPHRAPTAQP